MANQDVSAHRRGRSWQLALASTLPLALSLSCAKDEAEPAGPWPAPLAAVDTNPDPRVVEVDVTARAETVSLAAGSSAVAYRYHDRNTPVAPEARTGLRPLLIDAEVGDDLVVHFRNELPEATTIHWHGVRVPAKMDGSPPRVTKGAPVSHADHGVPAGGAFDYAFTLKDAGLFWFHPHLRADTDVDRGLYGVLRVRPRGAPLPSDDVERIVVLDDIDLDGTAASTDDHDVVQLGRGGATILVNGVRTPSLIELGRGTLLRFVNVANGRFFKLAARGHAFRVEGTDGGRYPEPYLTDELVVVPGERVDAVLVPADPGASPADGELVTLPVDRGHGSAREAARSVARFRWVGAPPTQASPPSAPPPRLEPSGASSIRLGDRPGSDPPAFTLNDETWPDITPLTIPIGRTWELDVSNETTVPHPFHLHGFFFQVLERDGVPEPEGRRVWKDTVAIPKKGRLRVAATFDEPGTWMVHCHILEHAEHGMMSQIVVE